MSFEYSQFWADLIEDLQDPEFFEAYIDASLKFMKEFHEEKVKEEAERTVYEDTHDSWTDSTGRHFYVHMRNMDCDIHGCAIHNPSYHPLSDAPQVMREDKWFLIERVCTHGIGHPDPDSASFMAESGWGKGIWVHGCDGCCQDKGEKHPPATGPRCRCGCTKGQHMGKPTGCLEHGFHEFDHDKVERGWGPKDEDADWYEGMTPDMFGYDGDTYFG